MEEYLRIVASLYEQLYTLPYYTQAFYGASIIALAISWYIIFKAPTIYKILSIAYNLLIVSIIGYLVNDYFYVTTGLLELPSLLFISIFLPLKGILPSFNKENIHTVRFDTDKGPIYIDLRRHGGIFGGSGAGKTDSGYVPIIKHIFKYGLPASIYDYKEWELWEKVLYFAEQQRKINLELELAGKPFTPLPDLRTIYMKDPNYSDHFNFMHPMYIPDMEDVEMICGTLFDNLYPGDDGGNFFKDSGSAILAGVTWRMKEDYTEFCDYPHISQIILNGTGEELIAFISKSSRAAALASPFLKSAGNEKQMASVISSVAAALKKIATPTMYTVLSKNDFDVAINKDGNHTVLGMINVPSRDDVYGPILATIASLSMNQMAHRGRQFSICVWDEASTFKFKRLDKVLATLRTYKIMVIWGLQDKIQGTILYSENILRAILANLGMKIIGKANDPDTADYYTKLFETIDVKERSVSESNKGNKSTTTSVREKGKYKIFDFQRLKPGEFFFLDTEANDKRARVKPIPYENVKPEKKHSYTREQIESKYDQIVAKAKSILETDLADDIVLPAIDADESNSDTKDDKPFKINVADNSTEDEIVDDQVEEATPIQFEDDPIGMADDSIVDEIIDDPEEGTAIQFEDDPIGIEDDPIIEDDSTNKDSEGWR